ncbi:DUF2062 domain-containing protein [Cyanobacterium stanieri LEGE 03274]|uniref:DUF2062 domain-containing protein n=1 Tax=Cyanobacterium stanieri LEGE 03274 TaxID=1828756 RepID=A0ABR9V202_9CHRO|nr:DUF2062 domain-containing protein [Cyanobacterium stanieri]MBE9221925.1 DUF2062 domain-containing protein [Cyanobacterium stanieri LEGE 03274]
MLKNKSKSIHNLSEKKDISLKKKPKKSFIKRYYQYFILRILRVKEKPKAIARGFAIGVFTGSFPFFGLQMIVALLLAIILRANKATAMMGTWISNPFTYVPIFLFNYQIGLFILENIFQISINNLDEFNSESWQNLADSGAEITVTLLTGSFFVGLTLSILAYYLILILIKKQNKTLHKKYWKKKDKC